MTAAMDLATSRQPNFFRFLRFLKPHWKLWLTGGLLMLCSIGLQLPMPLLTMYLIDHIVPEKQYHLLNLVGFGLLAFLLLKAVSAYGQNLLFAAFRNRVMFAVRRRLFLHLEHLPLSFFRSRQAGYLTSRMTSDVNQLQWLMANTFLTALKEVLTFLVGVGLVLWINWKLGLIALAILPFYVFWLWRWNPRVRQIQKETQESHALVAGDLLETVSNIYIVKSFMAERRELVKMLRSLRRALNKEFAGTRANSLMTVGATLLSSLGKVALIWFGCWQIMRGDLSLGGFLAFNSFLSYLFDPADNLVSLNLGVQQSLASVDRLFEILDQQEEDTARRRGGVRLRKVAGRVEFKQVGFSYDGAKEVLSGLDLTVEPGVTCAIVGESGSGKSTLAALLLGLFDPTEGEILIDGVDIRRIQLRSLRQHIGLVPQDTYLFSGDVWSNLLYGRPDAAPEAMIEAARLANAHEFLMRLPEQYDTEIGERGAKLSGGQRQRLSIAMAFLKDAPILILDEATSSLDNISEELVQEAVSRLRSERTTFIIAHRLTTVKDADVIVVLKDGCVAEIGKHDELLRRRGVYHRLYAQSLAA